MGFSLPNPAAVHSDGGATFAADHVLGGVIGLIDVVVGSRPRHVPRIEFFICGHELRLFLSAASLTS